MSKRITLSVRMVVSVTVDAEDAGGAVEVVRVVRVNGLPSASEVMEALDAEGDFQQLDEEYEKAPETAA